MDKQKVKINVNGIDYEVEAGQNVLSACRSVGVEIPFFCYHPHLKVAGSCRMCLVSIGTPARDRQTGQLIKNEDGSLKIAFMPKPAIACGTTVCENMHVITDSEEIKSCRQNILEFILLNHPLDCPICDKAGECKLQEYASAYGNGESRYVESKNVKPKKVEVAGKIIMDSERCILCSRCVRFCKEIIGKPIFGFTKRGSKTEVAVYANGDNESNYLLNVVDGCPVGALTEKAFRFQMRTWFLKTSRGICSESSAGANTTIWSRSGEIFRITPRRNEAVNATWMSDSGRYIHKLGDAKKRLSYPRIDSSPCELSYAINRCVEILKLSNAAIVASARQTLEEMFLLKMLAETSKSQVFVAAHISDDDGKLVSCDRTPNMRGAFATGLISKYPETNLKALAEKIDAGEIKTVLCFDEDLKKLGFESSHFKKANIIYCSDFESDTSACAKICVPLETEFEKGGIWINRQFRMQKFDAAVSRPADCADSIKFLSILLSEIGGDKFAVPTLLRVREVIAERIPLLAKCVHIPEHGALIDASSFANVEFPETAAFNFDPSNVGLKTGESLNK